VLSSNDLASITDIQILFNLIEQCLTLEHVIQPSLNGAQDGHRAKKHVNKQGTDGQEHTIDTEFKRRSLETILQWIHDLLVSSPESCEFMGVALSLATQSSKPDITDKGNNTRTGRGSRIRIRLSDQSTSEEEDRACSLEMNFDEVGKQIRNPLWTQGQRIPPSSNNGCEQPSTLQCFVVKRFLQNIIRRSILQPSKASNVSESCWQYRLSEHAIRIVQLIFPSCKSRSVWMQYCLNDQDLTTIIRQSFFLLRRLLNVPLETLNVSNVSPEHTKRIKSHPKTASVTQRPQLPYRLLQKMHGIDIIEDDAILDCRFFFKNSTIENDRGQEAFKKVELSRSFDNNDYEDDKIDERKIYQIFCWLSAVLNLFIDTTRIVGSKQTKTNSTRVVVGLSLDEPQASTPNNYNVSEWRCIALHGIVVDILEQIIIPNDDLHMHPLAFSCIAWFQTGLQYNYSAVTSRNELILLLRTKQPTSKSTPTLWRYGATAIDVSIQFLHIIVVRQLLKDHDPESREYQIGIRLCSIRDTIIRFLHNVLLYVQDDRKRLGKEQKLQVHNDGKEHGCNKTPSNPKNKEYVTFMSLILEYRELYTSAAASLLYNSCSGYTSSYYSNNDHETRSSAENQLPFGVQVHPDIRLLLQHQMQELDLDQEEEQL
jgi:hypothetical protein